MVQGKAEAVKGSVVVLTSDKWAQHGYLAPGDLGEITEVKRGGSFPYDSFPYEVRFGGGKTMPLDRSEFDVLGAV